MSEDHRLNFYGNVTPDKAYEIDLEIRDVKGNPTGIRKSIKTDDPVKLWEFYMRNQGRPKRKKKKKTDARGRNKSKQILPTAKEADQIMTNMYTDTDDQKGK